MHLICSKVAQDEKEEAQDLRLAPVASAPSSQAALPAGGLLVGGSEVGNGHGNGWLGGPGGF